MRSWWGYSPESLTCGVFFNAILWNVGIPQWAFPPLRIHRGSVESGSAAQKKRWVVQGQRGMKGQAEEKDMGPSKERPEIHKPHTTINPSRIHASFSYVCVRRSVWYRMQNIMPIHWYRYSKCERVVCWRCLTSIWFPEKSGQMKFYVFFFLSAGFFFPTEVAVLIRHVKGQPSAPYMETQCLKVCGMFCMSGPHAKAAVVCC